VKRPVVTGATMAFQEGLPLISSFPFPAGKLFTTAGYLSGWRLVGGWSPISETAHAISSLFPDKQIGPWARGPWRRSSGSRRGQEHGARVFIFNLRRSLDSGQLEDRLEQGWREFSERRLGAKRGLRPRLRTLSIEFNCRRSRVAADSECSRGSFQGQPTGVNSRGLEECREGT